MTYLVLIFAIVVMAGVGYYFYFVAPRLDPSNRASEYIKNNQLDQAIDEYLKILDDKPYDSITHYRLADLYMKIDEIDEAAIHYQKVIDLDKFNHEVSKLEVEKKLALISVSRDDEESVFKYFYDIVRMYPADSDAIFHTAFISLGQEEFDIAQRYFDRLVKNNENNFEIMFGAGVCSFQNQKFNEAVTYFKNAVSQKPESEVANLAMVMALIKKRDFKTALTYANKLIGLAQDSSVKFVAIRIAAFCEIYVKHNNDGVNKFEELLEFARRNEMQEEIIVSLYDIGFACIRADMSKRAYDFWNELFSINRNYRNISDLIMALRREMESSSQDKSTVQWDTVNDMMEDWLKTPFPNEFLWEVCSLKSKQKFDLKKYIVSTKVTSESDADYSDMGYSHDLLEKYMALDTENFKIISNRLVGKIGYKVDQIMQTYRENDGIDFMAINKETKEKTFVWVRRWKQSRVGEIPLRNFAQMINDVKAAAGLFVTTSPLTEEAQKTVANLSKVTVVLPEELNTYLRGLL
jgi:tetratricopeptide (TPR) repeat protein